MGIGSQHDYASGGGGLCGIRWLGLAYSEGAPPTRLRVETLNASRPGSKHRALDFSQSFVQVPDKSAFDLRNTWTLEAWDLPSSGGER